MKITIELDPSDSSELDKAQVMLSTLSNNPTSSRKTQTVLNGSDKKTTVCAKCGRDLNELYPADEVVKIINFCGFKFKKSGNVYCRDCQTKILKDSGGGSG